MDWSIQTIIKLQLVDAETSGKHHEVLPFCLLGNFACFFFGCLLIISESPFLKKIYQECHQGVNQFWPDRDPNCLHRLSADDTSR